MIYSSTEAHSGYGLVLPIAEFASDEESFFYRINPFLNVPLYNFEEFAEEHGYTYYDKLKNATLDGEELDVSLGVLVKLFDGDEVDTESFEEWQFGQALNAYPNEYIGNINIVESAKYGATSYHF